MRSFPETDIDPLLVSILQHTESAVCTAFWLGLACRAKKNFKQFS